jgi:hypothetical protein
MGQLKNEFVHLRKKLSLNAFIVAKVAFNGLPQELGPTNPLFSDGPVYLLQNRFRQIEQHRPVVAF